MRDRLQRLPPPLLAGALVFLLAFGLFAATSNQLVGYEPETAAVTAGIVEEGHLWGVEDPALPSLVAEVKGKGGHTYARTGLLQPLLEVPFFAAGQLIDRQLGEGAPVPYRLLFLWFFNPFVAACAAAALFALVYLTRRSLNWAIVIAGLFVFASIAWPYAKIGMETTFMLAVLAAFALAAWARLRTTAAPWALTGFSAGAVAATKPYSALAILPLALFLWPAWIALERRRRLRLLVAAVVPMLAWAIAICWYNWARFGSISDFGYQQSSLTLSMPLNVLGLIFSPGKGLIFYSPLVVLGVLGLPRLWRADRWLAISLVTLLALLTCVSGASTYWGDEVWGPRYLVAGAWALLVPIAWWCDSSLRARALAIVAAVGFVVAFVGTSSYYGQYVPIAKQLTGLPIYEQRYGVEPERIPYGDDPPRWIPQLSPLLLQAEGLVSSQIVERLGFDGLTATYAPFEGPARSVDFSQPEFRVAPDYFWRELVPTPGARIFALAMALMTVGSGIGLYRLSRRESRRQLTA